MEKSVIYIAIMLVLTSCHSYRMLEGKSRRVSFTPDSSVFSDNNFARQSLSYDDLLNIRGNFTNVVELINGEVSTAVIHQPTIFRIYDEFLVYPREHIIIKKDNYNNFTFLKINGSKRRNRELSFFKAFQENEHFPEIPNIVNASLDTILSLEKNLKSKIPKIADESRRLFDSLTKEYRVSKKFKKLTKDYLENRSYVNLYHFYKKYKDSLQAHALYIDKCKLLLSKFNNTTNLTKLNNTRIAFNELTNDMLPYKIWKVNNENEFQASFDTIENNFSGLVKDYLLSQLLYTSYTKRILIPPGFMEKYNAECRDKSIKKLLKNVISQQQQNDSKENILGNNSLLPALGEKISLIEEILESHKGKLIFMHFWASWCFPCREEIPSLRKLMNEYPKNKIVFLSVSIDREIQPWQKAVIASNTEADNHYLLINSKKSKFIQQYDINSIPRYFLIDKDGKIINSNAPSPSNPMLKTSINMLLSLAQ